MVTTLQTWGTSQGLRLAKDVLAHAHIAVGDDVSVCVETGAIVMTPVEPGPRARPVRGLASAGSG
jgi:antitoxin component of MazEF toxin-antitoxin module